MCCTFMFLSVSASTPWPFLLLRVPGSGSACLWLLLVSLASLPLVSTSVLPLVSLLSASTPEACSSKLSPASDSASEPDSELDESDAASGSELRSCEA